MSERERGRQGDKVTGDKVRGRGSDRESPPPWLWGEGLRNTRGNDRVQARGGCGVVSARADLVVRVSPPPAGGEAASRLKRCWAAIAIFATIA